MPLDGFSTDEIRQLKKHLQKKMRASLHGGSIRHLSANLDEFT
jgi:hypothetical protein